MKIRHEVISKRPPPAALQFLINFRFQVVQINSALRHIIELLFFLALHSVFKRRDFFSTRQHFCFEKLGSSNSCIFEMKHATGMETCTKIYILFKFNVV